MEAGSVCVIGAGITGITVAKNLARAGVAVALIDKNPYPGGRAIFYGCKAADACVHCGVCQVRDAVGSLGESPLLSCHFSTVPSSMLRAKNNGYLVELETKPNPIDWKECTECGVCISSCSRNAIRHVPGWKYYIDADCTSCGDCVGVCPVGAIRLDREERTQRFSAQSVVVASGFRPFDPSINRKWGYGRSARVVTGSEMEKLFHDEAYDSQEARKIAFVHCVGSRDIREGEQHCSRVCCAYALRMADRIKTEFPESEIDMYYMDIQHFGKNFEAFMNGLKGRLNFIRSIPVSVKTNGDDRPIVRYESLNDLSCREAVYDLVVLANGVCPSESTEELAEIFGLDQGSDGFLRSTVRNSAMEPDSGIFVAGSCRGPMRIEESVEDASIVSHRVLRHLGVGV